VASSASSVRSRTRSAAPAPLRFGEEVPRVWTPPLRRLTPKTSRGFEVIRFADEVLELELRPWQKWLLIHALETLEDGSYRYRTIVLLVARQNGKSTLLQVLTLWSMYIAGSRLVIGTAQNLDVAEEQWSGTVEMAEGVAELAAEIPKDGGIVRTNGKKTLKLESGERYKVAAASRRGGRGLSGDLILLDELREHQSWDAWAAVTKTTNARENAQIWAASNAGDSTSVVLRHLRKMAHAQLADPDGINTNVLELDKPPLEVQDEEDFDDDSLGIFEWSAAPGISVYDRKGWAQANPSMGHVRSMERAIASDSKTDPEWIFRTEVLCQWSEGTLEGAFPAGTWEAGLDDEAKRRKKARMCVGVDTSWDRSLTYIAWASYDKAGKIVVSVQTRRAGTDWVVPWLKERVESKGIDAVAFQTNGAPISSIKDEAEGADLPLIPWASSDLARWTGLFYDKVCSGDIKHTRQPPLDLAAAVAATRPAGDSWIWDRKNSPADIAPLVAATAAVGALLAEDESFESAYATDDLMVV
jgi:hypothetical protein